MSTRSLCCLRYSWSFYLTAPSFFLFWLILSLALQCFTSYLSSRTSAVAIQPHLSPSSTLTYGVPQGSVLGPILFNVYTTPLSTLISSSTISHLLYADDTQLFVSLTPQNFPSVISDLQSTVSLISSWMSPYFLTLHPSKTEYLLIDLPQQTSKNPSLSLPNAQPISQTPFAKNLGFIFDSTLSFSKQISSLSSACHYHIRDLRRIYNTIDYSTASTIATTLVHSRLDFCNSLYHALPATQIKRLQQIPNALARTVARTSEHSRITPALKSLHWLKIEQRIQFKIVSIIHNLLHKSQPSYLRKYLYQSHWQNSIIRSPLSLFSATHIQAQILRSLFPQRFSASMELFSHQSQVSL